MVFSAFNNHHKHSQQRLTTKGSEVDLSMYITNYLSKDLLVADEQEPFVMFLPLPEKLDLINITVTACRGKWCSHCTQIICFTVMHLATQNLSRKTLWGLAMQCTAAECPYLISWTYELLTAGLPSPHPFVSGCYRRGKIYFLFSADDPQETRHTEVPLRPCFVPLPSVRGSHCLFTQLSSSSCESKTQRLIIPYLILCSNTIETSHLRWYILPNVQEIICLCDHEVTMAKPGS